MHALKVTTSFQRPADTTAYTANDAINNSTSAPTYLTFANVSPAPGVPIFIRNAIATKTSNGVTTSTMRLFLFNEIPANIANDNAAYLPSAADILKMVGYIDFALYIAGTGCAHSLGSPKPSDPIIHTPTSHRNLYGILQASGAYTPANAELFYLTLCIQVPRWAQ